MRHFQYILKCSLRSDLSLVVPECEAPPVYTFSSVKLEDRFVTRVETKCEAMDETIIVAVSVLS